LTQKAPIQSGANLASKLAALQKSASAINKAQNCVALLLVWTQDPAIYAGETIIIIAFQENGQYFFGQNLVTIAKNSDSNIDLGCIYFVAVQWLFCML
jgi:phospholipase C